MDLSCVAVGRRCCRLRLECVTGQYNEKHAEIEASELIHGIPQTNNGDDVDPCRRDDPVVGMLRGRR